MEIKKYLLRLAEEHIWDDEYYKNAPVRMRIALDTLRVLLLLYRDIIHGPLGIRAAKLFFITLLSIGPLLVSTSLVLECFNVVYDLGKTLQNVLTSFGTNNAEDIVQGLHSSVVEIDMRLLDTAGIVFLIYLIVLLARQIESTFNHAWHLHKSQSIGTQFVILLSAITMGSLIIIPAIISITNQSLFLALLIPMFTLLYMFIPNTRVRFVPALIGGVASGVFWSVLNVVSSNYAEKLSNLSQSYGNLFVSIHVIIWLYLNWLILLIGVRIAFYCQYPKIIAISLGHVYSSPEKAVKYVLLVLAKIVYNNRQHKESNTFYSLVDECGTIPHVLAECLDMLRDIDILRIDNKGPSQYSPNACEDITVQEVVERIDNYQPAGTYVLPSAWNVYIPHIHLGISSERFGDFEKLTLGELAEKAYGDASEIQ